VKPVALLIMWTTTVHRVESAAIPETALSESDEPRPTADRGKCSRWIVVTVERGAEAGASIAARMPTSGPRWGRIP